MASVDTDTGELQERRLARREEAEKYYRGLAGQKVRVGTEASGHARCFERLLAIVLGFPFRNTPFYLYSNVLAGIQRLALVLVELNLHICFGFVL
jgi:hypothetical protein